MAKVEVIKIGHVEFRKDCAKGQTFKEFQVSFSNKAFDYLDKSDAYVKLGGKGKVPKKKTEEKE